MPQGLPLAQIARDPRKDAQTLKAEDDDEETVQVRPVRQGVRQVLRPGAAQPRPHRREAERVHHLPQAVPARAQPEQASGHPFAGQAVPLSRVQEAVRQERCAGQAYAHPLGGQAAQVHGVRQGVHQTGAAGPASDATSQEGREEECEKSIGCIRVL